MSAEVVILGRVGYDLFALDHCRPLPEVERFSRHLGGSSANIVVGLARVPDQRHERGGGRRAPTPPAGRCAWLVRYYGAYFNAAWGKRGKADTRGESSASSQPSMAQTAPEGADRAALRRRWPDLIRRVWEVDPLVCPRRGGEMRVIARARASPCPRPRSRSPSFNPR